MRHRVSQDRLSRPQDQRRAVLRSLATDLLRHDEITTTLAKAKALRSPAERMITLAKKGFLADRQQVYEKAKAGDPEAARQLSRSLHLRRQAGAYLQDRQVVKKLFEETAPRYADRKGGYTRIIRTGFRRGDASPMAIIQLV